MKYTSDGFSHCQRLANVSKLKSDLPRGGDRRPLGFPARPASEAGGQAVHPTRRANPPALSQLFPASLNPCEYDVSEQRLNRNATGTSLSALHQHAAS